MTDNYQEALDKLNNFISEDGASCDQDILIEAVATLQELINNFKDCKNELCMNCGKYQREHLNACVSCRWN